MPIGPFRGGEWRRSICPYCGTGCGIVARERDGAVEVRGDRDHPVNAGQLCAKGALVGQVLGAEDRLLRPMVRDRKGGHTRVTDWDEAIERAATGIRRAVEEHGPDAVMLYGSGQLPTEDYYLFGKLAKGYLRTNNQDTNSRLCMASAVAGYTLALGSDSPPAAYADIEQARTFLLVGANVEACHPILFNRIRARRRADPGVRVIVIDPRRTRTAEIADCYLPVHPGADVPLLNAILAEVVRLGGVDADFVRRHTDGWERLQEALTGYSPQGVSRFAGVPAEEITRAAELIVRGAPLLTMWTMGINQSTSGVDKNLALLNLSLATGNIGKPGAGPFSLTGQPNAMGGREAGGLATTLPGHRQVSDATDRAETERLWGLPAGTISDRRGATAIEMVERLESGAVRVVWVAATNPVASLPNGERVRRAFERADLVIVQDPYYPTETGWLADVLLPAAQWSERPGVMTNSERRVCLMEQITEPPGEALPDWQIICRMAAALGFGDAFTYPDTEAIFAEYRETTRGRDLDITGIDYAALRAHPGGIQWPYPAGAAAGSERLFTDGRFRTPDRRARFHVPTFTAPAEELSAEFPLALVTGRLKDQWHTMTRTGRIAKLARAVPAGPTVDLHPDDAAALGIAEGAAVRIVSRRGRAAATAHLTVDIRPGTAFAPFHWGAAWARGGSVNDTTSEAFDPRSREPELKFAAVRIEPAPLRTAAAAPAPEAVSAPPAGAAPAPEVGAPLPAGAAPAAAESLAGPVPGR